MTRRRASDADPSHHLAAAAVPSSSRPVPRPRCLLARRPWRPKPSAGRALQQRSGAVLAQAFEGSAPLQALVDEVLANNRDLRAAAARAPAATAGRGSRRRAPAPAGCHGRRTAPARLHASRHRGQWQCPAWAPARTGSWTSGAASATRPMPPARTPPPPRDRDAAALSLAPQAVSLQTELIGLGHRLQLARETLTVQRQLLAIVKARVDAGRGTAADTARAESLLASTEASVPSAQRRLPHPPAARRAARSAARRLRQG